jgi:hypothetical protein
MVSAKAVIASRGLRGEAIFSDVKIATSPLAAFEIPRDDV